MSFDRGRRVVFTDTIPDAQPQRGTVLGDWNDGSNYIVALDDGHTVVALDQSLTEIPLYTELTKVQVNEGMVNYATTRLQHALEGPAPTPDLLLRQLVTDLGIELVLPAEAVSEGAAG